MEYNEVIKSTSYNQHEILKNIQILHNNGNEYECDMTYSSGKFYGEFEVKDEEGNIRKFSIKEPKYKFDVCPQFDDVVKINPNDKLPLEDNSIESIVIDLPFVISPHTAPSVVNGSNERSNLIFKRFSSYYPVSEMFKSYTHWLEEAFRVLKNGGICVFKCQNTISGSIFYCTEEYSWMEAQRIGFYVLDRFTLLAKARLISGKVRNQQHARNFSSVFWVFKKGEKHKTVNYYKWK